MIAQGARIERTVIVANQGPASLTVSFIPTCTCLTSEPATRAVPARGQASFLLRYDSSDDTGVTRKDFIVSDGSRPARDPFSTRSPVPSARAAGRPSPRGARGSGGGARVAARPRPPSFSPTITRPVAEAARSSFRWRSPGSRRSWGSASEMEKKDILVTASYQELSSVAAARGGIREIPAPPPGIHSCREIGRYGRSLPPP